MKPLRTKRLILRQWEERDRPLFHRINSDERVMRFFPMRRTRAESDALIDRLAGAISDQGFGFAAAEIAMTGETIGFVGITRVDASNNGGPRGSVEIGWRLAPEYWGKGYATEAALKWLEFGFETLGLPEIISFAVWSNEASVAVMRRIGMEHLSDGDFLHPSVPDTHPELKRHVLYRMRREHWLKRESE